MDRDSGTNLAAIEQLSMEESGSFTAKSRRLKVHSHSTLDIVVYMVLHYKVNQTDKQVKDVRTDKPYVIGADKYSPSVSGSGNAEYDSFNEWISVSCAGTLTYYNPEYDIEDINFNTEVYPF